MIAQAGHLAFDVLDAKAVGDGRPVSTRPQDIAQLGLVRPIMLLVRVLAWRRRA